MISTFAITHQVNHAISRHHRSMPCTRTQMNFTDSTHPFYWAPHSFETSFDSKLQNYSSFSSHSQSVCFASLFLEQISIQFPESHVLCISNFDSF